MVPDCCGTEAGGGRGRWLHEELMGQWELPEGTLFRGLCCQAAKVSVLRGTHMAIDNFAHSCYAHSLFISVCSITGQHFKRQRYVQV